MASTIKYDNKDCSRCGGTGKHSWCQTMRDTCFQCGGAGKVLTKKGLAALAFVDSLRAHKIEEIRIGQRAKTGGHVTEILVDELNGGHKVKTDNNYHYHVSEGGTIPMALNGDMIDQAILFQSRLTKQGKLMKKFEKEYDL